MTPVRHHPSAKFVWAFSNVSLAMAISLGLLSFLTFVLRDWLLLSTEDQVNFMIPAGIFSVLFAFVSVTKIYRSGLYWPIPVVKYSWPLALFVLLLPPTIPGASYVVLVFNLLLWFAAYKLLKRLHELSPVAQKNNLP
jgi:hypothetical protein